MKKLTTLLFVFLFTAGITFAQDHSTDVEQVGYENQTDVLQQSQDGASEAYVDQNGSKNSVDLEQVEYGLGGHYAEIAQMGSENVVNARTQGHKHNLFVDQTGTGNYADVSTLNLGDLIDVDQSGNNNTADVYLWPGDNNTTVYQDGNQNNADVTSEGTNSTTHSGMDLRVYQDGFKNDGRINVALDNGSITGGKADIVQLGDNNFSTIDQFDGVHTAEVRQNGNWNTATVEQDM